MIYMYILLSVYFYVYGPKMINIWAILYGTMLSPFVSKRGRKINDPRSLPNNM